MASNKSVSEIEDIHREILSFFSKNANFRQQVERLLTEESLTLFAHICTDPPKKSSQIRQKLGWGASKMSRKIKYLSGVLTRVSKKYQLRYPIQVTAKYGDKQTGVVLHCGNIPADKIKESLAQLGKLEESDKEDIGYVAEKTDLVKQARRYLLKDAVWGLKRQLRSENTGSYVPLKLQIGNLPTHDTGQDVYNVGNYRFLLEHGRVWNWFDEKRLKPPDNIYVISSISGTGKTTFLRHLQWEILKKNGPFAIYLKAKDILDITPFSGATLIDYLAKELGGTIPPNDWENILYDAFKRRQIMLLTDALDNLGKPGANCAELAERILNKVEGNPVVMAGRPSVVRWLGNEQDLGFLRLKPFDIPAQQVYFGKYFTKALQLCERDRELLKVPMYAYLVRALIEKGEDRKFQSRWDLYTRFLYYVLYKHPSNIQEKDHDRWVVNIRDALGRLSYRAIDLPKPALEAISYEVCTKLLSKGSVHADVIPSTGIAELVEIVPNQNNPYLVFCHSTFQEYLAANWARQSEERTKHVVNEVSNAKWREVIKFLAGCLGESFINKVYPPDEKDDENHSRLFLAAECCGEIGSSDTQKRLCNELIDLVYSPLQQSMPASYYDQVCNLMQSNQKWLRMFALRMFGQRAFTPYETQVNDSHLTQICDLLENEDLDVRGYAFGALRCASKNLLRKHVARVLGFVKAQEKITQKGALDVLMNIRDLNLIRPQDVDQIITLFASSGPEIGWQAADTIRFWAQRGLKLLPYQVENIISFLDREDISADTKQIALYTLGGVVDKASDKLIDALIVILRTGFIRLQRTALRTIQELAPKLSHSQISYILDAGMESVLKSADDKVRTTAWETKSMLERDLKSKKTSRTL